MRCHFWRVGERGGDRCCRPDSHSIMASLSSEGHRRTRRTRRKGDVPLLTLTLMLLKLRVTRGLFPLRDKSPFCQQKHIYFFVTIYMTHQKHIRERHVGKKSYYIFKLSKPKTDVTVHCWNVAEIHNGPRVLVCQPDSIRACSLWGDTWSPGVSPPRS